MFQWAMVNSEDSLWSHMLSVNILCKVSIKVCRCVWTYAIQTLECVIHISWTVYMKVQWKVNGFAFEDLNRQCSCILPLLSNKQNRYVYEMSMTFKLPKGILLIQLCSHVLCRIQLFFFFFMETNRITFRKSCRLAQGNVMGGVCT